MKQYKADQAKKAEVPKKTYDRNIWAELKEKIPWEKNAQAEAKRAHLWKALDFNGNGHLSFAEVDKGMVPVFKLPQLFKTKPVYLRAFNAAKGKVKGKSRHSDDYIQRGEFRDFCKYIRMYYEYWVAFDLIDKDGDKRISFTEFKQASP